jgi:uncharacterized protein (DUF2267 family)
MAMHSEEFLGLIQYRAKLDSSVDAVWATRATLQALAECLSGTEVGYLVAQLPMEIAVYLLQEGSGSGKCFSLDDFFERISELEREDLSISTHHARIVLEVLREAVSEGVTGDSCAYLSQRFNRLFSADSKYFYKSRE